MICPVVGEPGESIGGWVNLHFKRHCNERVVHLNTFNSRSDTVVYKQQ